MPLVCKVTDFGESRSQNIHTHTVLSSKATHVSKETSVFKGADIWVYGMVVFVVMNSGLKHPFQIPFFPTALI